MSHYTATYDAEQELYTITPPLKLFSRTFPTVTKRALENLVENGVVTGMKDLLELGTPNLPNQKSE